jgi:hypothetical protein
LRVPDLSETYFAGSAVEQARAKPVLQVPNVSGHETK